MAYESTLYQGDVCVLDYTPDAALTGGEVIQLADGRAGITPVDIAASALGAVRTEGVFIVQKTTGIVLLDGGRVYWDHSANKAHFKPVNDRDFYIGTCVGDATSAATTCVVNLNVQPVYKVDALASFISVATGTAAAGGFGKPVATGKDAFQLSLTATNEAQCVDILSRDRFALGANAIVEAVFMVEANGSTSAVDINVGIANASSTTDADAIAESCFIHIDGGALDLLAESDDGTTEVAATDTTVNFAVGNAVAQRVEVWLDLRNPADIQIYIDGVNVLPDAVFTLAAATGPLGLLAHVEKTSGTATAGPVTIEKLAARTAQK